MAYGINILPGAWPANLGDFPNYFSFFLAPHAVAVILSLAIVRQERVRQHTQDLYDELRVAHRELQALHQEVRSAAVAEERNRLAREIHDSLAHYLTVANVQLEAAESSAWSAPLKASNTCIGPGGSRLTACRTCDVSVAALRAATLEELALDRALERLCSEFSDSAGIPVQLTLELDDAIPLAPELAQALYRSAQEGLTNVHRHAQASRVQIELRATPECAVLVVQVDGVGPLPANGRPTASGGYGLLGLRERVALLDGQLSFGAAPGGGSCLRVPLPIQRKRRPVAGRI